ncbi:unnamed protein product [Leptidea sinapis]|uniref:CUB domain-containing protein n=1 Tax=Leptidea sinapis TaxID=189913 RepID=A0A5E4PTI3_9NEOP|nr:unnamed protein product [Leptidea sinapis]
MDELKTLSTPHLEGPVSCSCIRFTSSHGKTRGTFSSPDYPHPYPHSRCLLYTFLAQPHQIVEITFTEFDIYKEHLE